MLCSCAGLAEGSFACTLCRLCRLCPTRPELPDSNTRSFSKGGWVRAEMAPRGPLSSPPASIEAFEDTGHRHLLSGRYHDRLSDGGEVFVESGLVVKESMAPASAKCALLEFHIQCCSSCGGLSHERCVHDLLRSACS